MEYTYTPSHEFYDNSEKNGPFPHIKNTVTYICIDNPKGPKGEGGGIMAS